MTESIFETLNMVDVSNKTKEKGGLTYLSWSSAWAEVKKKYPKATYEIIPQVVDEGGNTRFWHVEVKVTIGDISHTEVLAIMDYKNKSIPAESITSVEANKSLKRCLVKALAMHGLGLYIYEGEDLPEKASKIIELQESIKMLVNKKVKLSDKAKEKVAELCKAAEKKANPNLDDDLITGNYNNIEDADVLANLEKQLLAVRK